MNSIVNNLKKKRALARNEAQLRRLIAKGARREKLLQVAEEVKQSRIRVLRMTQAVRPPTDVPQSEQLLKYQEKLQALLDLPVDELLKRFLASK